MIQLKLVFFAIKSLLEFGNYGAEMINFLPIIWASLWQMTASSEQTTQETGHAGSEETLGALITGSSNISRIPWKKKHNFSHFLVFLWQFWVLIGSSLVMLCDGEVTCREVASLPQAWNLMELHVTHMFHLKNSSFQLLWPALSCLGNHFIGEKSHS